MKILNIDEVIELKKALSEQFSAELHLHDACGGQSFSLNNPSRGAQEYIEKYCRERRMRAVFYEPSAFVVKEE